MKNEKTMLALVLVAALAMVSVAGVALASESDAADVETTYTSGNLSVPAGYGYNIFVYQNGGSNVSNYTWSSVLTVADSANYSGTITVGIKTGSDTKEDPIVYTSYMTYVVSGASDVRFTVSTTSNAPTMTVEGPGNSTIDVQKGAISVANPSDVSTSNAKTFSGVITAADLTVTAVNTGGFTVTYGTVATISGSILAGIEPRSWDGSKDTPYSTVTLGGTGYYSDLAIKNTTSSTTASAAVGLIIADGANISNDVSTPTIDVTLVTSAGGLIDSAVSGTVNAVLIGQNDGKVHHGAIQSTASNVKFTDVPVTQTYAVILTFNNQATPTTAYYYYNGTMSITADSKIVGAYDVTLSSNSATSVGSATVKAVIASVTTNMVQDSSVSAMLVASPVGTPGVNTIGYDAKTGNTLLYDAKTYTYVTGYNVTTSANTLTDGNGKITGTFVNNDVVFIVLQNIESKAYSYFLGKITITDNLITGITKVDASAASVAAPSATIASGQVSFVATDKTTLNCYTGEYVYSFNINNSSLTTSRVGTESSTSITFKNGGASAMNLNNGDIVVILTKNATGKYSLFFGDLTVAAVPISSKLIGFDCATANSLTYYSSTYSFVSAVNLSKNCTGTETETGVITFGKLVSDDYVQIVLRNNTSGAYVMFVGKVTVDTAGLVTAITGIGTGTDESYITPTGVASPVKTLTTANKNEIVNEYADIVASKPDATITNYGIITINGTLSVGYVSENAYGTITNNNTIDVTGKIVYEVATLSTTAPLDCLTSGKVINAACYYVKGAEGKVSTFYYTSLATAAESASTYSIYGTLKVLEDTTLTGTSTTVNKVTIEANSMIVIGVSTDDETISAVLTMPKTTTLVNNGLINVVKGKFVTDSSVSEYSTSKVSAAVFVSKTDSKAYTDLVTALKEAVSGDTLKLRQDANIESDASVITGVTLNGNSYSITVASGATLTVDGTVSTVKDVTVQGKSSTKAAGQLVLNSIAFAYNGTFTLTGGLTFGTAYDNTASSATAFGVITVNGTNAANATITVNGNVKFGYALAATSTDNKYVTFTVAGTAIANADLFNATAEKMIITGTFTAKVSTTIDAVTVTGNGSLVGSDTVVVTVGGLISGAVPTKISGATNSTTVKVTLADGAVAKIYGTFNADNIVLTEVANGKLFTTAYYLTKDVIYATFVECDAQGTPAASELILSIAEPEIASYVFNGWYTSVNYNTKVTNQVLGALDKVYGSLTVKTVSVTVSPLLNGHWVINGDTVSGGSDIELKESGNVITFVANTDYKIDGTVTILVNGNAMPSNYEPKAGDVISVTASIVKDEKTGGMDLVTILLIIITIVIVIMAIIIALKLMRS